MKMALAAFLVVLEYILTRITGLDMGRFLNWHSANLMAYEEILAESRAFPVGRSHPHRPHSCDRPGWGPVCDVLHRKPYKQITTHRSARPTDHSQHLSLHRHCLHPENVLSGCAPVRLQCDWSKPQGYRTRTGGNVDAGASDYGGRAPPIYCRPQRAHGVGLCSVHTKLLTGVWGGGS